MRRSEPLSSPAALSIARVLEAAGDCKTLFQPEPVTSAYAPKLHDLVKRLRDLVKAPEVPFIAGQMGKFDEVPWTPEIVTVDQAHQELPKHVPNTTFVTAEGLKHKGDKIHFDAAAYRELGKRYAEAFSKMTRP